MERKQYLTKLEDILRRALKEVDNLPNENDEDILTGNIIEGLSDMIYEIQWEFKNV